MASSFQVSLCLMCGKNPKQDGPFCTSCALEYPMCYECGENQRNWPFKYCVECYQRTSGSRSRHQVPLLQRLDVKKSEYKEAYDLFKTTWVKGALPEPEAIYAITNCKLSSSFQTFTKQLREEEADASTSRVFHGTSLLCDMLNNAQVCRNSECGVCGITQMGFDPSRIGTNIPRFMRYGRGFYFAPNSSKCHDYTQGAEEYGVRAQLLCLVASGTRFETTSDHTSLTQPPQQYDSVYGRAGGTLNYPEVVVYQREAILPQFVIMYRHNGVHKIAK